MRWIPFFTMVLAVTIAVSCSPCKEKTTTSSKMTFIDSLTIKSAIDTAMAKHPKANTSDIATGVTQVAKFWMETDGSKSDFVHFCTENFLESDSAKKLALEKISRNQEIINGHLNKISLSLKEPLHLNYGEITAIDQMYGGYDLVGHVNEDFFKNKINFYILLNYKYNSLKEASEKAPAWNRYQWAMLRLGQLADSRVPGDLVLKYSDVNSQSESYISEYNIYMGNLVNDKDEKLFPADMKLISHWGLRDELKADYNAERGLEKQKMVYSVMQRIINQDIPQDIINSPKYQWNPINNKVFDNHKEIAVQPEPDTRYQWLLNNFKALKEFDAYNPFFPSYMEAKFNKEMEIPQPDVEKLFINLVSATQVKRVAALIEKRLHRKLEPFDIWYDGFKPRGNIDVAKLDKEIQKKYPTSEAFEKDIPNILVKPGL